jgi:hypothetical protein
VEEEIRPRDVVEASDLEKSKEEKNVEPHLANLLD